MKNALCILLKEVCTAAKEMVGILMYAEIQKLKSWDTKSNE